VEWIHSAEDSDRRLVVVNTVMNLRILHVLCFYNVREARR
jgi:hypothetical protein